jgi:hypothetical protein
VLPLVLQHEANERLVWSDLFLPTLIIVISRVGHKGEAVEQQQQQWQEGS